MMKVAGRLFADRRHWPTDGEAYDVSKGTIRLSMTGKPAAMQQALTPLQS
jgi:hypothetical protein